MIIGECPYGDCEGSLFIPSPDGKLPIMEKHNCESCKRVIWIKHSRVDPQSWTDEDFYKVFSVDEETKIITEYEN